MKKPLHDPPSRASKALFTTWLEVKKQADPGPAAAGNASAAAAAAAAAAAGGGGPVRTPPAKGSAPAASVIEIQGPGAICMVLRMGQSLKCSATGGYRAPEHAAAAP